MKNYATGALVGTGAALSVMLGWVPDRVEIVNVTDGDLITIGYPNQWAIPFTSGGTTEIRAGDTIVGATSGATAVVGTVLLASGSWAGGDAAGVFLVERGDLVGTFGSENVDVGAASNLATVTVNVTHSVAISDAVASATSNSAITAYDGAEGSAAKGFTIGSTVSKAAKLLRWSAWRAT